MDTVFFLMLPVCVSSVSFHTRDSCPADVVEWNKSKHHFNCSKTEFYHCLLDERNRSGEFCISERPSRVQIDFCPRYNSHSGVITTEPCNMQHGCPTVPFTSNEVYKCRYSNKTHTNRLRKG
ncbi:uncharacterized protein LOC130046564 isoform X1 [Ostrea edulis]|uniref:uncharacterized protein LOC130046564 isoform X1 n=1 Tax=Ostrea edulis TaxID=37623 RepID=UPI0024AFCB6C|nr:uncharacterized protein LOC130046564 isoform X1 [Ostrea edulis]